MSEVALIAKVRQSKTSPTGQPCNACPSVGMPILPVRVAVVPKAVTGLAVPATVLDPALAKEEVGKLSVSAARYALRSLRPGFLYLYYPVAGKAWTWRCIMISPSGSLREIPLTSSPDIAPSEPKCGRAEHAVNSSLISILEPESIPKAYIAYSEHFWTEKTRNENAKLLGTRMREFSPAQWWASQAQASCLKPAQLEKSVLEYDGRDLSRALADDYFDYQPRHEHALGIKQRMEMIAPAKGMVLVVPDPIGCLASLNSLRMHALSRLKNYIQSPDIAWKHASAIQIQGLRDYVQEQAKAQIKTPTYAGRGRTMVKTREQRIKEEVEKGWGRFEEHYSESKRTQFLKDYGTECTRLQKDITALDKDYALWLGSASYKLAKADYDRSTIRTGGLATILDSSVLAGGVLSEHSLKVWTEMLQRKADDLQNYAVMGILANQEKWAKGFQSADEKTLGDYAADWGTVGKAYDMARNGAESDKAGAAVKAGVKAVNQFAGELLQTTVGSIGAISADAARKGLGANDALLKSLDRLQVKLGLAHAHLHLDTSVVLIKIELTVDEWHRIASGYMRANLGGVSKQTSEAFAAMAMSVQLRVPANSAAAQKLVPFLYWMSGTSAELSRAIKAFGEAAIDVGANIAGKGTQAIGAAVQGSASATLRGAQSATRTVSIVGHNLKQGAAMLAGIPSRLSASAAVQSAMRLTRNGLTIGGSTDVRFAGVAICFQVYGFRTAMSDYQKNVGWKQTEVAWAMGSALMGLLGAVMDLSGKAILAVQGGQVAGQAIGISVIANRIVRTGGLLGAGASAVDAIQGTMKAYTLVKRGDMNSAGWVGAGVFTSVVAVGAGLKIAAGSAALFGPVGLLILCIGAGLVFAYMAFMAEDTPIGVWLDRGAFGNGKRSEGKFPSQRHETDALEMIGKQLVIQLEWHDTFSVDGSDEISIVIKRPVSGVDAVAFGVRMHGVAGQADRRSYAYLHGASFQQMGSLPLPAAFTGQPLANASPGERFEATGLFAERECKVAEEEGSSLHLWEERIEVNSDKFAKATVYIRYFPDKTNPAQFLDQTLALAD